MFEINNYTEGLKQDANGIWHGETSEVSYPTDGNTHSFEVEDDSYWFHHRNNCISLMVSEYPPSKSVIFDIGGGNGFVSKRLQDDGMEAVLVEPGLAGARNALDRGVHHIIQATTDKCQIPPHSIPSMGLFDVIEHVENDVSFMESMKQLLERKGMVYATVPAYSWLWSHEDVRGGHFRRYTLSGFSKMLERAGFEIVFGTYIFQCLPLAILLFRVIPFRIFLGGKSIGSEPKKSEYVVRKKGIGASILTRSLNLEMEKLKKGGSLKFGGSCLVVARAK